MSQIVSEFRRHMAAENAAESVNLDGMTPIIELIDRQANTYSLKAEYAAGVADTLRMIQQDGLNEDTEAALMDLLSGLAGLAADSFDFDAVLKMLEAAEGQEHVE